MQLKLLFSALAKLQRGESNYGCQSGRGPCETDECYATFYISKAFPQMLQIAQNA